MSCTRSPAATQATSTEPTRAARNGASSLPPGHRPSQPRSCHDHKGSRVCRFGGLTVGQPVPQGAATEVEVEVEACGFNIGPRQLDRRPPLRRRGRWRCATAEGRADPFYFQYIAHRGACGKPRVVPHTGGQRPEPTDMRVTTCVCCCRHIRIGRVGTSTRWGDARCRCGRPARPRWSTRRSTRTRRQPR